MIGPVRSLVPTVDELRAMTRFVQRRAPWSTRAGAGSAQTRRTDDELVGLVDDPFDSVADVLTRLRAAETHLRDREDRRAVFLTVYTAMTANVEAGIESGRFDDPHWVRAYLVDFADRYRRALIEFERGDLPAVPPPWRIGFAASVNDETLLIQDALLGINAHINYDLTYTLRDVSIDPDRGAKHRDHDRINDVLRSLVDAVQESLVEVYGAAGYRKVDDAFGPVDEAFTLIGLTEARTLAWRNAVLLTDYRYGFVHRLVDWRIRVVSTGASDFILVPSADPSVRALLREIETREPVLGQFLDEFHHRGRTDSAR